MDAPAVDLAAALLPDRADQPLLTFYDDATGERTELSAVALGDRAARATALLRQDCGLGPGDRAAVLLPPHWQTAVVLLGSWAAGLAVSYRSARTAGLPVLEAGGDEPLDAVFVADDRLTDWLDQVPEARHRFRLGLAPLPPGREPPAGYRDFLAALDRFAGTGTPPGPAPSTRRRDGDPASVDGTSFRQWGSLAASLAQQHDLRRGDRVLMDAAERDHPVFWLLAPLAAGASVVLCANLDATRLPARIATESVNRVL
ncbi:TIGR03089 family protein [Plantactinospora sp. KBS50]|uniref:TIGR03089 family protein n=1 Tax=Plantactinospora sp. KBS50 TaxID=2024580 RepID=UPI000BAAB96C|nr:TIGR03089 family protein [Plantactinospora sp. KBS50]ASW55979.1 hypothetical protein CIK06_20060 [Plantactinospora sp. KBS50]